MDTNNTAMITRHIENTLAVLGLKAMSNVTDKVGRMFITGYSGAGKTTFANKLGETTRLPVIHVDEVLSPIWHRYGYDKALYAQKKREAIEALIADETVAIVEGISLLKHMQLLQYKPLVIMRTRPFTAAWRHAHSPARHTRFIPLSFVLALHRNFIKWGREYRIFVERDTVRSSPASQTFKLSYD